MNCLSVKAKFQIGQFKNLKLIFCECEGQFDLKDHKFLEQSKTFRWSIHSFTLKVKFLWFKICCIHKELHKIFKFQGKFYREGQGQGHQFSNPSETFICLINSSSWKVKFETIQK